MKKITALAAGLALLLPSVAIAQESLVQGQVGVEAGAGVSAGGADASAAAGADAAAEVNVSAEDAGSFDDLVASVTASASTAADLSAVTDATDIQIVQVATLEGNTSAGAEQLKAAITANESAVADLRSQIAANAAIMAKLTAAGYSADDVVAVKTALSGSVIVYVDTAA